MLNTNFSYFYDLLGAVLWALRFWEAGFIRKNSGWPTRQRQQPKKITAGRPPDPTLNKGDAGSLTIVAYDTGPLVSVSRQTVRGLLKSSHVY
jgi:hypothetical protein